MNSESKNPAKLFTIGDVAESIGVCERTVRRWIKKRLLAAHHFDGVVRISEVDFRSFLASHRDN